ncbi:MAG: hypothetical protein IH944_01880 [Armatimonadetes bacterium]|nr:hypothetical protein [Armatimonadota bacterium]
MRTKLGFVRNKYAIVSAVAIAAVIAAWGLYPREAAAQSFPSPQPSHSSGHITLRPGESVRIGMLLPAVERPREAGRMVVTDGNGHVMFDVHEPLADLTPFYDIAYHEDPGTRNVFVLTDGKSGRELGVAPSDDGILIALLIPAVQHPRKFVPAHGASVQLFGTDGFTLSVELFFDSY